jgi:hypothetical protein
VTDRTEHPAGTRDDDLVMLRRLSLPEHGVVELLMGLALIAAPLTLGFGPAGLLASMAAGALLVGLGLGDGLAISAHMAADFALAMVLLTAAVALAASDDRAAGGLLAAAAACELALSVGTRWTRRESRAR